MRLLGLLSLLRISILEISRTYYQKKYQRGKGEKNGRVPIKQKKLKSFCPDTEEGVTVLKQSLDNFTEPGLNSRAELPALLPTSP